MEAVGSEDIELMEEAFRAAAPGSLAAAYARAQTDMRLSDLDSGVEPVDPQTVTQKGTAYEVCPVGTETEACLIYDDFEVNAAGQLANFTIGGKPIAGRLAVGNGSAVTNRAGRFTFLSSYLTQSGYLAANVEIAAGKKAIDTFGTAVYRAPDGRQRQATDYVGPDGIEANSRANVSFYFKGPIKTGGTMTIELWTGGDDAENFRIKIKVG
jgi:hypothetical protein